MNKIFVDITKLLEIEDGTQIFGVSEIDYSNLSVFSKICVSEDEVKETLRKIEESAKFKDSEVVTNWHYPTQGKGVNENDD